MSCVCFFLLTIGIAGTYFVLNQNDALPSQLPTGLPTIFPAPAVTLSATIQPTQVATKNPSGIPTILPTTLSPTNSPTTNNPTFSPTYAFWSLSIENTINLVFRFNNPKSDVRVAFWPGNYKSYGSSAHYNEPMIVLFTQGKWLIREETGNLVIRDTSSIYDRRYAFGPASGNRNDFGGGVVTYPASYSVLYSGYRWSINCENNVLVFRDNLSGGDNRYAFFQKYIDM